uniref:Uncharacterized protein n=1 Tax=Arundo donax TaxID=35708 RepID=A0A0A9HNH0_ARUDO
MCCVVYLFTCIYVVTGDSLNLEGRFQKLPVTGNLCGYQNF